jgi:hypothetical protein
MESVKPSIPCSLTIKELPTGSCLKRLRKITRYVRTAQKYYVEAHTIYATFTI